MDPTKKRKTEENILQSADVLHLLRHVTNRDVSRRKLFVRGLSADSLRLRRARRRRRHLRQGHRQVQGLQLRHLQARRRGPARSEIDGRVTATQYAAAGNSVSFGGADVSARKIYVGMVPFEISSERLLAAFAEFGEIDEGPLGFVNNKSAAGKSKGFAFFVYKTEEGARATLAEPTKNINGHSVMCKLAVYNKKTKHGNSGVTLPPQQQMGMFRPQQQPQYPGFPGRYQPTWYNNNYSQYGAPPPQQLPPNSVGMPPSQGFGVPRLQHHQAPAMPRGPVGGMFQGPYKASLSSFRDSVIV